MNFCYTVDPSADEPIMLINKHIGFDDTDGCGIMGDQFQAELLALDGMGKKRIQVWINSVGGIVMDGYNIYNAILKSQTKVDTYCVGIAASIAGVIFQAGRKRIMSDYGVLMYHNPYGGDDGKQLDAMKKSLVTMVASRSKKPEGEVSKMMDRTTWITASEALENGLCDAIEYSQDHNKPRAVQANDDAASLYKSANKILNKIFEPKDKKSMKQVANKLGLVHDASEESILAAIEAIKNNAASEVKASADKIKQLDEEADKLKSQLNAVEDQLNALKKEKDEADAKAKAAEDSAKEEKAKNMVSEFVKTGRIKNDAKVIEKWINQAKADFDGTKELIESTPINKQAAKIETDNVNNNIDALTNVAARTMSDLRAKYQA